MTENTLPPGYHYKTTAYGDSEGIVISVALVKSNYKAGSFLDRLFGKKVLTYAGETSLEATTAEMDTMIAKLKQNLQERYFIVSKAE